MRLGLILGAALLVSGCVADKVDTPSGSPELTIADRRPDQIKPILINTLLNRGLRIKADTPYSLAVERPTKDFAATILLSTNFSGPPVERITFVFAEVPGGTRVVVDAAFVSNAGTAYEKQTRGVMTDELRSILDELSAAARNLPAPATPPQRQGRS